MLVQQNKQLTTYPPSEGPDAEVVVGRPFHSAEFVGRIEEAILAGQPVEQIAQGLNTTPYIVNLIRQRVYVAQLLNDPLLRSLDEDKSLCVKYRIAKKLFRKYYDRLLDAFRDEFPTNRNPIQVMRSILNISCVNAKASSFYTFLGLMIEDIPEIHLREFEYLFVSGLTRKIAYAYMRRYISPAAHCYLLRCARKRIGYRKFATVPKRSRLRVTLSFTECECVFYVVLGEAP